MSLGKQDAKSLIKNTQEGRKPKVIRNKRKKLYFFLQAATSLSALPSLILILTTLDSDAGAKKKKKRNKLFTHEKLRNIARGNLMDKGVASGLDSINHQCRGAV